MRLTGAFEALRELPGRVLSAHERDRYVELKTCRQHNCTLIPTEGRTYCEVHAALDPKVKEGVKRFDKKLAKLQKRTIGARDELPNLRIDEKLMQAKSLIDSLIQKYAEKANLNEESILEDLRPSPDRPVYVDTEVRRIANTGYASAPVAPGSSVTPQSRDPRVVAKQVAVEMKEKVAGDVARLRQPSSQPDTWKGKMRHAADKVSAASSIAATAGTAEGWTVALTDRYIGANQRAGLPQSVKQYVAAEVGHFFQIVAGGIGQFPLVGWVGAAPASAVGTLAEEYGAGENKKKSLLKALRSAGLAIGTGLIPIYSNYSGAVQIADGASKLGSDITQGRDKFGAPGLLIALLSRLIVLSYLFEQATTVNLKLGDVAEVIGQVSKCIKYVDTTLDKFAKHAERGDAPLLDNHQKKMKAPSSVLDEL